MKKRIFSLTSIFALLFGLSFGLASCSDNDLDASGGKGTDGIETAEQAEKHDALLRLLSAVADADSLPDNWNADGFTMEPTIGVAESEGNKFVRLVSTRNAEEADREFRCMIGDAITGKATDSEWTKEGIGTLKFKVQNQSDLYATIDVDVKQLPHLTQIRFVPASALGNNGWWFSKPKSIYYQFGDVIKQTVDGNDTYWVCVRPCSLTEGLGKSHWCTFQMEPVGSKNANFKQINDNLVLPTNLCSKESTGQSMVQNFFNVLRMIADPSVYEGEDGFDKIKKKEFPEETLIDIRNLWESQGIWKKVYNSDLSIVVSGSNREIGAYYYGYNKVFIGNGNYRLYRLNMKNDNDKSLFNNVTPVNPWVEKTSDVDFTLNKNVNSNGVIDAEESYNWYETLDVDLPSDNGNGPKFQYVVRYRTGAELEGSWGNDSDPENSFASKGFADVLASRSLLTDNHSYERAGFGFYALGDVVNSSSDFNGKGFCIKDANKNYDFKNEKLNKEESPLTYFVCGNKSKIVDNDKTSFPRARMAAVILYHILNAYVVDEYDFLPYVSDDEDEDEIDADKPTEKGNAYLETIGKLKEILDYTSTESLRVPTYGDYTKTSNVLPNVYINDDKDNKIVTVKAKFNIVYYELTCDLNDWKYTLKLSNKGETPLNEIKVFTYTDKHAYKETYSFDCDYVSGDDRTFIKKNVVNYVNKFFSNLTNETGQE